MPIAAIKKKSKAKADARALLVQSAPGMADVLPKDEAWWQTLREAAASVAELHDYRAIETPVAELASVIEAGLGPNETILPSLYTVKAKGGDLILRAETSLGILRSYLMHRLGYISSPLKVWTAVSLYRSAPPRTERTTLTHEFSFHLIGDSDPVYDVEAIMTTIEFLREVRIKDTKLSLNTLGCRVCKPNYHAKLRTYYQSRKAKLCKACTASSEKNPLRCLVCAEPECRELRVEAPIILDYLCQNCNNHFKTVLELIEDNGIIYEPNPYLVGDTDYYDRTVFEITTPSFPETLARGGRYDYLAETLHGRMVPAVTGAVLAEAVIRAMRAGEIAPRGKMKPRTFFIGVGEQAKKSSVRLMTELRSAGIVVAEALGKKSLKAQLRIAERLQVPVALLVGQKEAFEGSVIVRDMRTGAQETVIVARLVEEVKKRLK